MGTYLRRFLLILLLTFVGHGIWNSGEVYAGGGGFDVPQVNDHFDQFQKGPAPKKEEPMKQNVKEEKGTWDWITKPISDAWNWTVDKVSSAWEWTKETASSIWDWFMKILSKITEVVVKTVTFVVGVAVSFVKGVLNALIDTLVGLWDAITSPIETIKNLIKAISHPIETGKAIWSLISDSWEKNVVHGDAKSRAEWFGYAIGQIALAIVGTKGADKAVKLSRGIKIFNRVNKVNEPSSVFTEFKNLTEAQSWAEKYYSNWPSSLTQAEIEAVKAYTGSNYYNINSVLRGFEHTYEGKNGQYVELISQALKKSPVPEDIIVYRGVGKEALGEYKNLAPDQLVGKVIEDKGFMSTSLHSSSAFSKDIIFKIKVPKGTPGAYVGGLSHFPDEIEILLDKGQIMQFTEVKPAGGRLEITCKLLKRR